VNDFIFYFLEGWKHIISQDATDHLLFIAALSVIHSFRQWQKVLVLITSFTIGHAFTLYLSALDLVRFPVEVVEFVIPCTIVVTAIFNLVTKGGEHRQSKKIQYPLALLFGLVHGMGYANYIRMMLSKDQHFIWGLFSFNVGLEIGQIFVVLVILMVSWSLTRIHRDAQKTLVLFSSLLIAVFSLYLAIERFPFYP
jgi:hypothetical protein